MHRTSRPAGPRLLGAALLALLLPLMSAPVRGGAGDLGPQPWDGPGLRDCNGNGIEDAIDIALGTSADADFDGVPDECQVCSDGPGNPPRAASVPNQGR